MARDINCNNFKQKINTTLALPRYENTCLCYIMLFSEGLQP